MTELAGPLRVLRDIADAECLALDVTADRRSTPRVRKQFLGHQQGGVRPLLQAGL
jgi:hypothetical protein